MRGDIRPVHKDLAHPCARKNLFSKINFRSSAPFSPYPATLARLSVLGQPTRVAEINQAGAVPSPTRSHLYRPSYRRERSTNSRPNPGTQHCTVRSAEQHLSDTIAIAK